MRNFVVWLFELGYMFQHAATLFQIRKMLKKKNCELVSIETNILFLIGAFSRIGWIWDSLLKNFYLSYIEVIFAIITLGYAIYLYSIYYQRTLIQNDVPLPIYLKLYVLIPLVVILSFSFNPGSTFFSSQVFVSLGIFSEAIGLFPQFYIILRSKDTGTLSEFYIALLGIARFFRLLFWIKMYIDGNNFIPLIIADVIHCMSLATFIYNAIINWSGKGLPLFTEMSNKSNKKMF